LATGRAVWTGLEVLSEFCRGGVSRVMTHSSRLDLRAGEEGHLEVFAIKSQAMVEGRQLHDNFHGNTTTRSSCSHDNPDLLLIKVQAFEKKE
jgi:hypothetical protein